MLQIAPWVRNTTDTNTTHATTAPHAAAGADVVYDPRSRDVGYSDSVNDGLLSPAGDSTVVRMRMSLNRCSCASTGPTGTTAPCARRHVNTPADAEEVSTASKPLTA